MLSNAYFVAKFRFDTAENEPAKNLQNFREMHFRKMHFSKMHFSKMHFSEMHFSKMAAGRRTGARAGSSEPHEEPPAAMARGRRFSARERARPFGGRRGSAAPPAPLVGVLCRPGLDLGGCAVLLRSARG